MSMLHEDTLPALSLSMSTPPGSGTLPFPPFHPPAAPVTSRYLTALASLAPVARQVIRKAVETPRGEGGWDMQSSAAESWEEFGRVLLHCKDAFYPLHPSTTASYLLPLPSHLQFPERHLLARTINIALLLALLFPSPAQSTAQLSGYSQWASFLAQVKETYLLLCGGREKGELLWASLDRVAEICTALALTVEALSPRTTGLQTYRLIFSHSHLRQPALTLSSPSTPAIILPSDLARYEKTWSARALQEVRQLCTNPPTWDEALGRMREGLLKDLIEGVVPLLGDWQPERTTVATPFPSPMKPLASKSARKLPAAAGLALPQSPSPVKPRGKKMVPTGFAWNAPQRDAVRLTESSSFAELGDEEAGEEGEGDVVGDEEEVGPAKKGRAAKRGKGKGKAARKGRAKKGKTRSGSKAGTATETETEGDEEEEDLIPISARRSAKLAPVAEDPTRDEENQVEQDVEVDVDVEVDDESLPDVDEIIAETQLPPSTAPVPPLLTATQNPSTVGSSKPAPVLSTPTAKSRGKKRAREEEQVSPTPRAAKRQARSGASAAAPAGGGVPPSSAGTAPVGTLLPPAKVFFEDTQEPTPDATNAQGKATAAASTSKGKAAAPPAGPADLDAEGEEDAEGDDDDEVPEEEPEETVPLQQQAARDGEGEEVDQLRASVPVRTPRKGVRVAAGESSTAKGVRQDDAEQPDKPVKVPRYASTTPRKAEKKPKTKPERDQSASPTKANSSTPGAAGPRKPNRYATGGNETGRRAWTTVEDNALMDALKDLHEIGVHSMKWRTVLAWHGVGGSKTELLKERNNAQLKDRARNLFLKFQRNGQTPPVWLPER